MRLYPAIDLRAGRCVRLYQGDYQRETIYGEDPVAQALAFEREGASWLHVVDLDAARTGEPTNRGVIERICAAVGIPVEVGGGVRDDDSAQALYRLGVDRVVIGTAALEDPALVRRLADAGCDVAVGLDARGDEVATHGWTERTGRSVLDVAAEFADAGVAALIVTEIGRDGTLSGPDLDGLGRLLDASAVPVIASGGVGRLEDLLALAEVERSGRRFEGVIVGRALYEGAFTVAEAVTALGGDVACG